MSGLLGLSLSSVLSLQNFCSVRSMWTGIKLAEHQNQILDNNPRCVSAFGGFGKFSHHTHAPSPSVLHAYAIHTRTIISHKFQFWLDMCCAFETVSSRVTTVYRTHTSFTHTHNHFTQISIHVLPWLKLSSFRKQCKFSNTAAKFQLMLSWEPGLPSGATHCPRCQGNQPSFWRRYVPPKQQWHLSTNLPVKFSQITDFFLWNWTLHPMIGV